MPSAVRPRLRSRWPEGPGVTHGAGKCVSMSGLSYGYPRDMIFERQPGLGSKPPCRSKFCPASATRRFARSRIVLQLLYSWLRRSLDFRYKAIRPALAERLLAEP
jgi:hypothetical protein